MASIAGSSAAAQSSFDGSRDFDALKGNRDSTGRNRSALANLSPFYCCGGLPRTLTVVLWFSIVDCLAVLCLAVTSPVFEALLVLHSTIHSASIDVVFIAARVLKHRCDWRARVLLVSV